VPISSFFACDKISNTYAVTLNIDKRSYIYIERLLMIEKAKREREWLFFCIGCTILTRQVFIIRNLYVQNEVIIFTRTPRYSGQNIDSQYET